MKIIKQIIDDIKRGENLESLVVPLAAIIILILDVIGIDISNYLTPIILSVLSLLAISNIVTRHRLLTLNDETKRLVSILESSINNQVTAASFFHTRADKSISSQIGDARTLDMIGTSLISISVTNNSLIRRLKNSGSKIRLLIADPNDERLNQLYALRFSEVESPEQHETNVRTSLASLETLIGYNSIGGAIDVRTLSHDIWFSYIGVNTNTEKGRISVELYLTKVPLIEDPMFTIEANNDPHWFPIFKNQFEKLWENAKPFP